MPSFSIPLSGLTASSAALSTIANNIANLNTVGYKSMRTLFSDLFYQTIGSSGSGNPLQQGAGVTVNSMPSNFTPGSVDPSGVPTDVAISNDGFFVTQKNGITSYTRAGNFSIDQTDDSLVTAGGDKVMGYPAVNGAISTGQGLTSLKLGQGTISPATATTTVQIRTNLDASAAVGSAAGSYSTPITVYDSLGASHVLTYSFTKTAANTWTYSLTIPAADVGTTGSPVSLSSGTMTFDGNGNLLTPAADVANIAITGLADGASNLTFKWKLYDGTTGLMTQVASASSTSAGQQDGSGSGALTGFSIGSDGTITGAFSNGKHAILGQIALATFPDEQGLLRAGDNAFNETLASGQAVVGMPGTGGRGTLSGGALELSNVDIAKEFASLIVAQRGFEANARAVTTFDQITQDTINLKQ
jgi:flagellar hook protein FlgE